MKTIIIELKKTLADLQEEEGLDFSYDLRKIGGVAEDWFVVQWIYTPYGDEAYATCCTGNNNNLYILYGTTKGE